MLMIHQAMQLYINVYFRKDSCVRIDEMSYAEIIFMYNEIRFKKEFEEIIDTKFPQLRKIINKIRQR